MRANDMTLHQAAPHSTGTSQPSLSGVRSACKSVSVVYSSCATVPTLPFYASRKARIRVSAHSNRQRTWRVKAHWWHTWYTIFCPLYVTLPTGTTTTAVP